MRNLTISLIVTSVIVMSCGGNARPPIPVTIHKSAAQSLQGHIGVPNPQYSRTDVSRLNEVIEYLGYSVSYNNDIRIPNWVSYELLASETDGPYSRKGKNFRQDPSLRNPQAEDNDYKNSGWSRGHMAPAGDFKWSDQAMWDTFYYTNCCPQNQSLNAGQWNTLEQKVRVWAKIFGKVYVVTGPIIGKNIYGTIGYNRVVVPDAFFKVILADDQAIAFVMYNRNDNKNMQKCAMSVDDLETLTGMDFFAELDDNIENQIEASCSLSYWRL